MTTRKRRRRHDDHHDDHDDGPHDHDVAVDQAEEDARHPTRAFVGGRQLQYTRCPGCGGMVKLPCVLCALTRRRGRPP